MLNCSEARKLAGHALDRTLPGERKSAFFTHLEGCRHCRNEYEIELIAKSVIKRTLRHVPTPSAVSGAIVQLVRNQAGEGIKSKSWLNNLPSWRFLAPTLAAGALVVALTFLFVIPSGTSNNQYDHTASNDIIHQSLNNFSLVQSGQLQPSMIACYSDVIVAYFQKQDVEFAVSVPSDDSCDWYGAMASTYDGVKLAHVIFKRGDEFLYVYEVKKTEALVGSTLTLPAAAKESLAQTGWYTDPQHEDCSVVLWTVNETLCAAVSTMNKDRLLAFLSPP